MKGAAKSEEPVKVKDSLKITEIPEEGDSKHPSNHAKLNGDLSHAVPREVTVGGE
jgi:hypothetical protein